LERPPRTPRRLIEECCRRYPHAQSIDVDYAADTAQALAKTYFGGRGIPVNDDGGPFYSYFFGLHAATHQYVFHMDSDMMYGGGSTTWIGEAVQLLKNRPDVLTCSPLPGPPT
jgi:hypothetical protein